MRPQRLFKQALLVSPDERQPRPVDVLVDEQGVIRGVDKKIPAPKGCETLDCREKILLPGLFDMHVHLREPGREDQETIETGSNAAINGGVTGILAMPNTTPAIDSGGMVRFVQTLARDRARIPVLTAGCITRGREGGQLAEIADMHQQGAVMITDDGSPVSDAYLLRRALEYARHFNLIVASHCEVMELSRGGAMNEGPHSYRLGIPGIPACSEEICIERDLRLAQYTGSHIHIQHVSTARGLDIVRRFKEEGASVTCEVTPHHLLFSDTDIQDYNTHLKMNPPLRTAEDKAALLEGLKQGWIDVIATDHAPHTAFEKNLDFTSAPFGIIGLETALLSLFTHFVLPGHLGWDVIARRFSSEPRRILNREPADIAPGRQADFIVFDPHGQTLIDTSYLRSKSRNTPFLDHTLKGRIEKVILGPDILLDRSDWPRAPARATRPGRGAEGERPAHLLASQEGPA